MDTAGKAVLFSGVTVLISLSAVMLVPSPAFRSMALGIMLSVAFVLLAALTLLPAILAWLGDRVDKIALPWVHAGEHRSPAFARWAERLWRNPWGYGLAATAILVALALPVLGLETGMPSIKVVPEGDGSRVGYTQVQEAFGPGAPGTLQVVVPVSQADAASETLGADPGIANVAPAVTSDGTALILAAPTADPSDPEVGATIDRLRDTLPADALVGGAAAENHDLEEALSSRTLLVFGVVLALGFLLPWINITWIAEIVLNGMLLRTLRWDAAARWFSIPIKLVQIGIGYFLIIGPSIVALTPQALQASGIFDLDTARTLGMIAQQGARSIIALIMFLDRDRYHQNRI